MGPSSLLHAPSVADRPRPSRGAGANSRFRRDRSGFCVKEEAREHPGEPVIVKKVNSAFIGTDLEERLKASNIGTIVICGATTNRCVETASRMAGNLGFDVRLVRDATWSFDRVGPDGVLLNAQIDVTSVLLTVQVPTLVLHRVTDIVVPVELGRQLATQIPGARYIEYPEGDHGFWTGDTETLVGDIEEFVTGHKDPVSRGLERILATLMSPTSSTRRGRRPNSAISGGGADWTNTTRSRAKRSSVTEACW
ncbi:MULTISPECIES: isochorismatase family protein [unclassified Bradyrhizobium]|uniref:Isochorismatase family protein n=1 Tax=Bradyrhizobium sp. LLZ17 TaxID=3239388 RepID=A0AB39XV90_9BRAD